MAKRYRLTVFFIVIGMTASATTSAPQDAKREHRSSSALGTCLLGSLEAIDRRMSEVSARLPVPCIHGLTSTARILEGPAWASVFLGDERVTVVLYARPNPERAEREFRIGESEGIHNAAWDRDGYSYFLRVVCARTDVCSSREMLEKTLDSLVIQEQGEWKQYVQ